MDKLELIRILCRNLDSLENRMKELRTTQNSIELKEYQYAYNQLICEFTRIISTDTTDQNQDKT